jgi:thioredoxin reductase
MQLVVIGAGPVGLVAALGAIERGFEVTVLEAGEVGEHLRRWGPVRAFTPLEMNLPERVRARVPSAPPGDALLTGPELAERVLVPLAALPPLAGRVRTRTRVIAVGRARMSRGELPGHPLRGERRFQLLVETQAGEERLEADRVLDASGVYGQPLWLGAGGLPASGERGLGGRIVRHLGRLAARRAELAGRSILLVGHGHSAAHALVELEALACAHPGTRVAWAVRSAGARPCVEVADDPLPERRALMASANQLAQSPPGWLTVERRAHVESLAQEGGEIRVSLSGGRQLHVDEILALTGYRPDHSFLSELALELAPATEGAARLHRAVSCVTDCLSVPSVSSADLESGEPGFALVGHKSYGRARTFLLSTGYAQLEKILDGFKK